MSKSYNQKGGQTTFDPKLQIKICNHIKTNFPEFNLNTKIVLHDDNMQVSHSLIYSY